jgi:uncharacterized RmlC-like cupin family protein
MDSIRVITHSDLDAGPQTAGMTRSTAAADDQVWMGEVRTVSGAVSGWHHHGNHTTYGYVIAGKLHFDFGSGGRESLEAGQGDFFVIPPNTIHREGNPDSAEQVLAGASRIGSHLINVEGPDPL